MLFIVMFLVMSRIGNLLEKFKTHILNTIGIQLNIMKHKKKEEDERDAMAIFCPKCR